MRREHVWESTPVCGIPTSSPWNLPFSAKGTELAPSSRAVRMGSPPKSWQEGHARSAKTWICSWHLHLPHACLIRLWEQQGVAVALPDIRLARQEGAEGRVETAGARLSWRGQSDLADCRPIWARMNVQQHGITDAGSSVTPIKQMHVKITSECLSIAAHISSTFFSDLLYPILPQCQAV